LKLFLFFDIQSRMFGTASSLTDSNLEIIMLIAGEDVVRNAIFKNALIPFTCGQFSESSTLRCIVRMQLLCSRRFTSNAFLLYLSHFQEAIFLLFWNFLVIVPIVVKFSIHFGPLSRTSALGVRFVYLCSNFISLIWTSQMVGT